MFVIDHSLTTKPGHASHQSWYHLPAAK